MAPGEHMEDAPADIAPYGALVAMTAGHVAGLHIRDSIAFIEKRRVERPATCMRGGALPPETTENE